MGFTRRVTLICDGPCKTTVADTEKAPNGWVKVMITVYERLKQEEKPHFKPLAGWFCPACSVRLQALIERNHFSLSSRGE